MPSLTVENYVKTIYSLSMRTGKPRSVTTGELAQALAVSPGSVTGMLKTLSEAELATYTPYEGARLTTAGEKLALAVLRRHRLVELFLSQTLALTWDEVHEEAEHLEHAVSDRLVDRIDQYLGHPAVDPHGDPIPQADGSLSLTSGEPLTELSAGSWFRLSRVVEQGPAFLRYLSDCGLDLGLEGHLLANRPESGALIIQVGQTPIALGHDTATKLLVTPLEQAKSG